MWFIGVEVEQETSAPPPKKNPGSAPADDSDSSCDVAKIKRANFSLHSTAHYYLEASNRLLIN